MQSNGQAKNHVVIMPDANRESVINQITGAAFGACGQRCMALSVAIFVGESQAWIDEIILKSKKLRIGSGFEGSDLGPLISKDSKDRVIEIINRSLS